MGQALGIQPRGRTGEEACAFGLRVWDFGFRIWGLGFGVWGLKFGIWSLGFVVWGLGFVVCGLKFGVSGLGLIVSGFGFRVSGFGYRVRVSGVGLRVQGSGPVRMKEDRASRKYFPALATLCEHSVRRLQGLNSHPGEDSLSLRMRNHVLSRRMSIAEPLCDMEL